MASSTGTVAPVAALGNALGRYRLERALGAGAMGVVHAAFDPDLERRIALKVLRIAAPSRVAKDRLLREARALARLAHPNVVTVHEVGTAGGRDFIAMELIEGEPLVDWLRSVRQAPRAIIDAFVAAGRGLAAAHAAGIVHRDFKPHNVLRSHSGRIVVTDFGLAREAAGGPPVAHETKLPGAAPTAAASSLATLTVTGALLGTPAYMAPEQWSGGAVTPATDQFAYCVALWEALCGERPYRGADLQELQTQIVRGPEALDASKLPRLVRGILRRGLAADPARRWPNMNALLTRLERTRRRPGVAVVIAGIAAVTVAVLLAFAHGSAAPAPSCEPPARDANAVWSPAIAMVVRRATSDAHVRVLDTAYRDWRSAREAACTAQPRVRQAQLTCLDGVIERFTVLRLVYQRVPAAPAEELQSQMIDPAICRRLTASEVPRLTLGPGTDTVDAYELYARSATDAPPSDAELASLIDEPLADPCARIIATLAFNAASRDVPRRRSRVTEALGLAERCGDERVRANLLIQASPYLWEIPVVGPQGDAAIERAQAAAQRVQQPDVEAAVALQRLRVAGQRERWDEAFRLADTAVAGYGARGLSTWQTRAAITRNRLRMMRAEPGDLEAVIADLPRWRSIAVANHRTDLAAELDRQVASARFWLGDVTGGHAELLRLWQAPPRSESTGGTREIHGEVVDARGGGVAGATVAVASSLGADSVGIGVPALAFDDSLQLTTTDATGHFVITGAVQVGVIAAQLAERRSAPAAIADHVRLVLAPTRRVSGKVDLGGLPYTRLVVTCLDIADPTGRSVLVAPVAADGSFVIEGAPVGAIRVGLSINMYVVRYARTHLQVQQQIQPASLRPITDLRLALPSSARIVDVVVRSAVATPLEAAQVFVFPGKPQIRTADDLIRAQTSSTQFDLARPSGSEHGEPTLEALHPGDLIAHLEDVVPGELTVCAMAFGGDLADERVWQRMRDHLSNVKFHCEPIGTDTASVVIAVPPQPRFE